MLNSEELETLLSDATELVNHPTSRDFMNRELYWEVDLVRRLADAVTLLRPPVRFFVAADTPAHSQWQAARLYRYSEASGAAVLVKSGHFSKLQEEARELNRALTQETPISETESHPSVTHRQ